MIKRRLMRMANTKFEEYCKTIEEGLKEAPFVLIEGLHDTSSENWNSEFDPIWGGYSSEAITKEGLIELIIDTVGEYIDENDKRIIEEMKKASSEREVCELYDEFTYDYNDAQLIFCKETFEEFKAKH